MARSADNLSCLVLIVASGGAFFAYKSYLAATSPSIVIVKNAPGRGGDNGEVINYEVGFKNTGGTAYNWTMTANAMSLPSGEYPTRGRSDWRCACER